MLLVALAGCVDPEPKPRERFPGPADPEGARRSVEAASPVWELLGSPGVVPDADGRPSLDAPLTWQTRPGEHALEAGDWDRFIAFANLRL